MHTEQETPALPLDGSPTAQLEECGYALLSDYPGREAFITRFKHALTQAAAELHGPDCAAQLMRLGLNRLHLCFPVEKSTMLRRNTLAAMRNEVLTAMVEIAQHGAGFKQPFYVSEGLNLRIVYPFLEASKAPAATSNPHESDFAPDSFSGDPGNWLAHRWKHWRYRLLLNWNRTLGKDHYRQELVHYNRGRPAATWSHAPHQDSRTGQARNNLNIWCAIAGVNPYSGMVFYPEHLGKYFHCDPVTAYISAGQRPGKPFKFSMHDGEAMVFNPEMLHSSHLNISDETRIVISARVNPGCPVYNPEPLRPERHWHRSGDINHGRFTTLVSAGKQAPDPHREYVQNESVECVELPNNLQNSPLVRVCTGSKISAQGRLRVKLTDAEVLILRNKGRLYAFSARCPHAGVALEDGYAGENRIYCPGHGVAFNLDNGHSRCSDLNLKCYSVSEKDGAVYLGRLTQPQV